MSCAPGHVVLVDLPPEALRRRIASGQVYSADRVEVRSPTTSARRTSPFSASWPRLVRRHCRRDLRIPRSRGGRPAEGHRRCVELDAGQAVIERAAVLVGEDDADLDVVHVDLQDGLGQSQERLDQYREMAENVGARYREVRGADAAATLGDVAVREGASRWWWGRGRSRLGNLVRGSVASRFAGTRPFSRLMRCVRDERRGRPKWVAPRLPRRGAGRGKDLRHAGRGTARRSEARRRGRVRRDPRALADRGGHRRTGGRSPQGDHVSRSSFEEMDIDAVLAGNRSGPWSTSWPTRTSRAAGNAKRWQDVENCSMRGSTSSRPSTSSTSSPSTTSSERITGIRQRGDDPRRDRPERRPDRAGRHHPGGAAAPYGPRQHLRRPTRSTPRRRNYFQSGNLSALRELALLWVADRGRRRPRGLPGRHGITEPWETRERIVVALTGNPTTEDLIRRRRGSPSDVRGELLGVHVGSGDGLAGPAGRSPRAAP